MALAPPSPWSPEELLAYLNTYRGKTRCAATLATLLQVAGTQDGAEVASAVLRAERDAALVSAGKAHRRAQAAESRLRRAGLV